MTEYSPKVSIILPTYNRAKYLRQAIGSCLNQTYKNIELIIVDDFSTDETSDIINSYRDKRIKYIRHNKNKGLPHALNTGFAGATGEYFTWTSDDNFYSKEAIEKMLSFLRKRDGSFVYADYYIFNDEDSNGIKYVRKLSDVLALEKINGVGACFLYSRKVKEDTGNYDPDTVLAEDYDYWIRVSKKFTMLHLNEPLYFFREHRNSLFVSRYYEVKIVDYLVRIKNEILNDKQVTNLFIDLIVERNMALTPKPLTVAFRYIEIITLNKIKPYGIYKLLTIVISSKKINRILRNFQNRIINFENAKLSLKDIITRRLLF